MESLQHDLGRKSLLTTNFSFIIPKLKYGCHIWDNCDVRDSDLLGNLQLDMTRVVTGARKGSIHELLYNETNWQTLSKRRELFRTLSTLLIVIHHII